MRRLYRAVCSLIEAKANQTREPEPELIDSAAFTDHERSGDYEPDELHAEQYRIGFTSKQRPGEYDA